MISQHAEKMMAKCLFLHGQHFCKIGCKKINKEYFTLTLVILQADKLLKCNWLRPVVFKPNSKYVLVKITPVT